MFARVAVSTPIAAAAAALWTALLWAPAASADDAPRRTIRVTGEASVKATPDIASVSAGVVSEADEAKEAIEQNRLAMSAVIDKLKTAGVKPEDLSTSGFSLSPIYDSKSASLPRRSDQPRISGYRARNEVRVTVREVTEVGAVIDSLVESGANSLGGVSFDVSEPEPLLDEARKMAVADALRKAQIYAEAAGVSLGDIIEIAPNERETIRVTAYRRASAEAFDASTPIEPGQTDLSSSVSLTIELQ